MAVRTARAMGIDHEIPFHSPFEKEIRRRLWHQLRLLDIYTSSDRGTEPVITPSSFTTPWPSMINDSDFDEHSLAVPAIHPRAVMDTSLGCLTYDGVDVAQQLATTELPSPDADAWQHRMDLASQFAERIRENYIQFCNLADPYHRLIHGVAKTMVYSMMLSAVRPGQKAPSTPPPRVDDPKVLNIAVSCLRASEEVYSDEETQQWRWMVWVQWHALAVALAGLCSIQSPELVGEAWIWVDAAFARFPSSIADEADGMLWTPMKNLYLRAQMFQSHTTKSSTLDTSLSQESRLSQPAVTTAHQVSPSLEAILSETGAMINNPYMMDCYSSGWGPPAL